MAKRILVPIERSSAMEFTLRVVRMVACESGGIVRLLAVVPIPKPLRDARGAILLTTDQRMERMTMAMTEELNRLAATHLDGVPVETSVIFGDRTDEIGLEAECFHADLVVLPLERRRSPAAWFTDRARRLLAGRPANEIDVLRVSALRAQPIA
jgi:nucleotide-binding universal stress UspA family protein